MPKLSFPNLLVGIRRYVEENDLTSPHIQPHAINNQIIPSNINITPFGAKKTVLVGGAITILKNIRVRQWVSDDIPFCEMENLKFHGLKPPSSQLW